MNFSSLRNRLAKRSFTLGENIDHDWLFILHTFIIYSLIVFGSSTYFFLKIRKGDFFKTPKTNARSIETVNRAKLEKIEIKLNERQKKFEQARSDRSVVDPSI